MKIDKNTIKYIANLAMIKITEEEEEKYSKALEQILTYTEILNNLDESKLDEFKNPINNYNRFREDKIKASIDRELLIKNSKDTECGMFKVPKVL